MTSWDEGKRRINLTKHGLDFAAIQRFNWFEAVLEEDDSEAYGERRERATGWIGSVLCVYIYTLRGDEDHAISLRKVKPAEARRYARKLRAAHKG